MPPLFALLSASAETSLNIRENSLNTDNSVASRIFGPPYRNAICYPICDSSGKAVAQSGGSPQSPLASRKSPKPGERQGPVRACSPKAPTLGLQAVPGRSPPPSPCNTTRVPRLNQGTSRPKLYLLPPSGALAVLYPGAAVGAGQATWFCLPDAPAPSAGTRVAFSVQTLRRKRSAWAEAAQPRRPEAARCLPQVRGSANRGRQPGQDGRVRRGPTHGWAPHAGGERLWTPRRDVRRKPKRALRRSHALPVERNPPGDAPG